MRLLLLLLLSVTTIYAQESVLGVDIPKNFIVEYNEWDNIYNIYSSNIKLRKEKGVLEYNYLLGSIFIENTNHVRLNIFNNFWEDSEYKNKSGQMANAMVYIKNNDTILKKEIASHLTGESGRSVLWIADDPLLDLDLSFIIDNLNENSTLRIKDFANNIFEYKGKELKPLVDTIKLYKQLKQQL